MRIARLLVMTALLPIGVCSAQTNAPQADKTQATTKAKPTDTNSPKTKPTATKAEKPKKGQKSAQTGTKLPPEQERAYGQAYKTGSVPKP
jgi:hypothetical protein